MGSLYVGLQAEIMTSSRKRGLGYNEVPNGILGQSLCVTWKEPGLLFRHIHSVAKCFSPYHLGSAPPQRRVRKKDALDSWGHGRSGAVLERAMVGMYQDSLHPCDQQPGGLGLSVFTESGWCTEA